MKFSHLFFILLSGILLGWTGCDDEDDENPCIQNLPELGYSDGECSPELFRYQDFLGFPDNEGVSLISDCLGANDHGQAVRLNVPVNAGDRVFLHVYNGTYGFAQIDVLGSNDCGATTTSLLPGGCYYTSDAASKLTVTGTAAFDQIYLIVNVAASGPGESYVEYIPDASDEFIGIAAYGSEPEAIIIDGYRGYDLENEVSGLRIACDGSTTQRIIMGSCNPSADVADWVEESGLEVSEVYSGEGGTMMATEVPGGLDPNATGTALAKRRPRQNTDDYYAEPDYIITAPAPGTNALGDAQDFDPSFGLTFECLRYEPGPQSTEKRMNQVVVTMVDGGADVDGWAANEFERHVNRSIDNPYAQVNRLGHDFVFADNVPDDEFGHGTTTAGTVIGNYPGGRPLTVIHNKVLALHPSLGVYGTYFGLCVAVQVAGNIESDIINISLGLDPEEEPEALRCAVGYAVEKGAVIIASAGNDSANIDADPQWPAAFAADLFPSVVAVASYNYPPGGTLEDEPILSDFSNFGPMAVNAAAYLTAKTPLYGNPSGEFTYLAGTSISAPYITAELGGYIDGSGGEVSSLLGSLPSSGMLAPFVQGGRYLYVCD